MGANLLKKQLIMCKVYCFIVVFVLISFVGMAQPEGFTKVTDTAYIMQNVNRVALQTSTINTDFVQEKSLAFLDEKIISKGKLMYKKSDKFRLEYTSPFNYLLIMNGGKLLIKSDNNEIKINLESSKMFLEINTLIVNSIQGEIMNMPDMSTSFYENEDSFFVRMKPNQHELKKYIKTIELYLSKQDFTVTEFKVFELSDDYTLIKFVNKKINEEISNALFNTQ